MPQLHRVAVFYLSEHDGGPNLEHAMIVLQHNSQVVPQGKFVVYDDQRVRLSATVLFIFILKIVGQALY